MVAASGAWYGTVDSGIAGPVWESVNWTAALPPDGQVMARFRCAGTEAELSASDWGPLLDAPGPVSCPLRDARFGQVEVRLYLSPAGASPVLDHFTVVWEE